MIIELKNTKNKQMDLTEFRNAGFLQEANRLFFHPLGLALFAVFDSKTEDVSALGVFDSREDPEGFIYSEITDEYISRGKDIQKLLDEKIETRTKKYGWVIQPLYKEEN